MEVGKRLDWEKKMMRQQHHHAVRRYCIDRANFWAQQVERAELRRRYPGEQEWASLSSARCSAVWGLLIELESLNPASVSSDEEWLELVELAVQTAGTPLSTEAEKAVSWLSWQHEIALFSRFLDTLTPEQLARVRPVPHRRILPDREAREKWEQLRRHWNITTHYWYPLHGPEPPHVGVFDALAFERFVPGDVFAAILAEHKVGLLLDFSEFNPSYEVDPELLDPIGWDSERYVAPTTLEWMVYSSHEGSVTVSGEWLLPAIRRVWPSCDDYPWGYSWQRSASGFIYMR